MFRTELKPEPSADKISHHHQLLTIGSCFAQVIGEKLRQNKFEVLSNPFGTIFNPVSIFKLLETAHKKDASLLNTYVENNGLYFNHHLHSDFYKESKTALENDVKNTIDQVHHQLLKSDYLLITLGTAYVYRFKETGEIVANCHKVPSDQFVKELLSVQDIINAFDQFYTSLSGQALKIILTVSPVRHIKETIPLNAASKAVLRLACHELAQKYNQIQYFPAYEIMIDDLRDYRFYKEDMIHPTEQAENYIWEKFSDVYFNSSTKEIIEEWSSLRKAITHKPLRPNSAEYIKFLKETLNRLKLLNQKLNVSEEIKNITEKIQ